MAVVERQLFSEISGDLAVKVEEGTAAGVVERALFVRVVISLREFDQILYSFEIFKTPHFKSGGGDQITPAEKNTSGGCKADIQQGILCFSQKAVVTGINDETKLEKLIFLI